jgi:hypothetical protein
MRNQIRKVQRDAASGMELAVSAPMNGRMNAAVETAS